MNASELGQNFFTYLASAKPTPMPPGVTHAVLFADDEFLLDRERCLLNIPTIGEVSFEPDDTGEIKSPSWIAAILNPQGEVESLVPGFCAPFSDEAMEHLPVADGAIRAIPYSIILRAAEPSVQKLLQKYQPGAKRTSRWRGLIGRGRR